MLMLKHYMKIECCIFVLPSLAHIYQPLQGCRNDKDAFQATAACLKI